MTTAQQEAATGTPRIGSFCSGAGMLDEAVLSVLGGSVAWHCEHEPATEKNPRPRQAAARVLEYRYPDVPNHGDLTTVDWTRIEPIDVATAGYPCQPDSSAGKRLSTDDDRWIFPDIARALGVLRPRLVVLENVEGHLGRGFRTVLGSLAALGYDAQWTLVRASDVGAPHRRERLFVTAWPAENADGAAGGERWLAAPGQAPGRRARSDAGGSGRARTAADAHRSRREGIRTVTDAASFADALGTRLAATDPESDQGRGDHGDDVRARRSAQRRGQAARSGAATDADRDALWQQPIAEPGRIDAPIAGLDRADTAPNSKDEQPGVAQGDDATALVCSAVGAGGRDHAGHPAARVRDMGGSAGTQWGKYEPAIRRWERLTRPAPAPTEPGPRGGQRLSRWFDEWLMGWPDGWVTNVPGITRNDALRICGNGVVPQQAAAALRWLLNAQERAA